MLRNIRSTNLPINIQSHVLVYLSEVSNWPWLDTLQMALNGCHVPTNVYTQKKKIQIQNEKKDTSDAKAMTLEGRSATSPSSYTERWGNANREYRKACRESGREGIICGQQIIYLRMEMKVTVGD